MSSDNITILKWADNNHVSMISSFIGREPQDTIKYLNENSKKLVEISRQQVII